MAVWHKNCSSSKQELATYCLFRLKLLILLSPWYFPDSKHWKFVSNPTLPPVYDLLFLPIANTIICAFVLLMWTFINILLLHTVEYVSIFFHQSFCPDDLCNFVCTCPFYSFWYHFHSFQISPFLIWPSLEEPLTVLKYLHYPDCILFMCLASIVQNTLQYSKVGSATTLQNSTMCASSFVLAFKVSLKIPHNLSYLLS